MANTLHVLGSLAPIMPFGGFDTGPGGGTGIRQVLAELQGINIGFFDGAGSAGTLTVTGIDTVDYISKIWDLGITTTGGSLSVIANLDLTASKTILATNLVRIHAVTTNHLVCVVWFDKSA